MIIINGRVVILSAQKSSEKSSEKLKIKIFCDCVLIFSTRTMFSSFEREEMMEPILPILDSYSSVHLRSTLRICWMEADSESETSHLPEKYHLQLGEGLHFCRKIWHFWMKLYHVLGKKKSYQVIKYVNSCARWIHFGEDCQEISLQWVIRILVTTHNSIKYLKSFFKTPDTVNIPSLKFLFFHITPDMIVPESQFLRDEINKWHTYWSLPVTETTFDGEYPFYMWNSLHYNRDICVSILDTLKNDVGVYGMFYLIRTFPASKSFRVALKTYEREIMNINTWEVVAHDHSGIPLMSHPKLPHPTHMVNVIENNPKDCTLAFISGHYWIGRNTIHFHDEKGMYPLSYVKPVFFPQEKVDSSFKNKSFQRDLCYDFIENDVHQCVSRRVLSRKPSLGNRSKMKKRNTILTDKERRHHKRKQEQRKRTKDLIQRTRMKTETDVPITDEDLFEYQPVYWFNDDDYYDY